MQCKTASRVCWVPSPRSARGNGSASVPVYAMRAIGERENGDRLSVSRVLSAEDWELAQFDIVGVTARGMLDKLKDALSSR